LSGERQHTERIEMMLAIQAECMPSLIGVQRLIGDVGDERVGVARVVFLQLGRMRVK